MGVVISPMLKVEAQELERVDPVVVSATHFPSSAIDEPLSISSLNIEALSLPEHPAEIFNQAAGVNIQIGSGQEHLTSIRSPVLTGGAGAGSFLYLQDNVPIRSAGFANVNGLFDTQIQFADRVEIVRGPGDVAYGSNAVHGAINVITVDPLADNQNELNLKAGSYNRYQGNIVHAYEGEEQNLVLGLFASSDGGYREDSGADQSKLLLSHGVEIGDWAVRTRLAYHHLEQETAGFVVSENAYKQDDLRRTNPNPNAYRDVDTLQLSSQWNRDIEAGEVSITPYILWNDMDFRMHFLPSQAIEENGHSAIGIMSAVRRDLTADTQFFWSLDAEYARGSLTESQENETIFSYVQGLHYNYIVDSYMISPAARLEHAVTDKLTLQGGFRLTHTKYVYENQTSGVPIGRFIRPDDREDVFNAVTGKLAARYKISDSLLSYFTVSRGARPPQTTDLYRLQQNQIVGQGSVETLDMAELGLKYASPTFRASLAGFVGYKKNFLFRDADGFTVEDGETTHSGFEFDFAWKFTPQWTISTSGNWAEHKYAFDRDVGNDTEDIFDGNDVDTAPNSSLFVSLEWEPIKVISTNLQFIHEGDYYTDASNQHKYDGHDLVDWKVKWRLSNASQLQFEVKNIFDERYASRADFAFGNERYFPGEQRSAYLSWNVQY